MKSSQLQGARALFVSDKRFFAEVDILNYFKENKYVLLLLLFSDL